MVQCRFRPPKTREEEEKCVASAIREVKQLDFELAISRVIADESAARVNTHRNREQIIKLF